MASEVKQPDPRLHQLISFAKSGIRIGGSIGVAVGAPLFGWSAVGLVVGLAVAYGLAEVVGVVEELV